MNKHGNTSDRQLWLDMLLKISNPIIENLASNRLNKMPISYGPGYKFISNNDIYLEAICRTIAGLAPWLELPDDESKEGKIRRKVRKMVVKGLTNAFNKNSANHISFDTTSEQPIVEAAYLAQAFIRAPKSIWQSLSSVVKKKVILEFKSLRNRTGSYNNWVLFSAITECFLFSIDEEYDPLRLNFGVKIIQEWYLGDGWYSDGPRFKMDYYNSFVIHPMLLDILRILKNREVIKSIEYEIALTRFKRYAEFLERIISPEGTYPILGRSAIYRLATFQVLSQAALIEELPELLEPGQVRAALTKVIRNLFFDDHNFNKEGWLVLGINGFQPSTVDYYSSIGSTYITTLGFIALGLPANNIFWTDNSKEWTAVKIWKGTDIPKDNNIY